MTQLNFIDNQPLARTSDHVTSQASAAETAAKLGRLHKCVLAAAAVIEQAPGRDWTAQEVARVAVELFGGCQETMRKRCTELERAGAIREHAIRVCQVSGKPARSFRLMPSRG